MCGLVGENVPNPAETLYMRVGGIMRKGCSLRGKGEGRWGGTLQQGTIDGSIWYIIN